MVLSGTEPKLMDAGATEIPAALDVLGCREDEFLGAPITPMHPEVDKIKRKRKTAAVDEITLFPGAFDCVAHFFAPQNDWLVLIILISALCSCGMKRAYCTDVHLWYRHQT
jgi:hypothetical protein